MGVIGFRTSRPEDADALFSLWERAVEATHDFLHPEHKAFIAKLVRDEFLPHAELALAVDETGAPLGFLAMSGNRIDALFVDPARHGQGIGKALILRGARDQPLLLVDVNAQNASGVGFYRHLGFREIGRSATDELGLPYPLLHLECRRFA